MLRPQGDSEVWALETVTRPAQVSDRRLSLALVLEGAKSTPEIRGRR